MRRMRRTREEQLEQQEQQRATAADRVKHCVKFEIALDLDRRRLRLLRSDAILTPVTDKKKTDKQKQETQSFTWQCFGVGRILMSSVGERG